MDIKLDDNHDLQPVNGDLPLAIEVNAIKQHLGQRLALFLGEWFLDTTVGLPYYQNILVKNPNLDVVQGLIQNQILGTPGMLELSTFQFSYDNLFRQLSVVFNAKSTNGDINYVQTVTG
jgi:hypothetical protein